MYLFTCLQTAPDLDVCPWAKLQMGKSLFSAPLQETHRLLHDTLHGALAPKALAMRTETVLQGLIPLPPHPGMGHNPLDLDRYRCHNVGTQTPKDDSCSLSSGASGGPSKLAKVISHPVMPRQTHGGTLLLHFSNRILKYPNPNLYQAL